MITIIKVLDNVTRQEAVQVLKDLKDYRACIQPSAMGYKIGYMGWGAPASELENIPVHNHQPQIEVVDTGEGFQIGPQGDYNPNHGNVISGDQVTRWFR